MKKIAIICVILCTPLLINAQTQIPTLDDLDHEIAMSSQYDKQYEDVIRSVKKQLHAAKSMEARYDLSNSVDSAIVYAMEKQKIAKAMGNQSKVNDAKLNLAYLLIRGGELKEASDIINSIPRSEINQDLSFYYFSTRKTLYRTLADAALIPSQRKMYKQMEKLCNDSVVDNNQSADI